MDSSARAKRTASRAKSSNTESTSTTNNSEFSGGSKTLNLGDIKPDFRRAFSPQTTISDSVQFDTTTGQTNIDTPFLPQLDIHTIGQSLKTTDLKDITDVRNPGFSDDQKCNEAIFERAKNDYEDAIRYQQLLQWANKYRGEEFKTLASNVKAFQAGLSTLTDIEKAKQQFLELLKQGKITEQKGTEYIAQSHKTSVIQAQLPYTIAENEANLEQSRIRAQKSFEQAKLDNDLFEDWLASKRGETK
jgi:hypothetical protein